MTTRPGPYDQLLQAYAHSVRDLLTTECNKVPDGMVSRLNVLIGKESAVLSGLVYRDLGEKVRTRSFGELLRVLRRWLPDTAWPIEFELAFDGEAAVPRLYSLGFAGHHMQKDFLHEGHSRNERGDPLGGYDVQGLGKVYRAADIVCELFPDTDEPIMAWSIVDQNGYDSDVDWCGIHARSVEEAMLKWLFAKHGFEVVAEACRSGEIAQLEDLTNIEFVAQPVRGLDVAPRGLPIDTNGHLDALQRRVASRTKRATG